jgi:hypothetical protein
MSMSKCLCHVHSSMWMSCPQVITSMPFIISILLSPCHYHYVIIFMTPCHHLHLIIPMSLSPCHYISLSFFSMSYNSISSSSCHSIINYPCHFFHVINVHVIMSMSLSPCLIMNSLIYLVNGSFNL